MIIILNGAPRSGKSSIVAAIQESFEGVWMNLGVDVYARHVTPPRYQPGIGLRPGGERPDLEPFIGPMSASLYESAAAHDRLGLNVVMDLGHHDLPIWRSALRRLSGARVLIVGVRCPIEVIMQRRNADTTGTYAQSSVDEPIPAPVQRWQDAVHNPGIYDLEVDTSILSPGEIAHQIRELIHNPPRPTAAERLASFEPLP